MVRQTAALISNSVNHTRMPLSPTPAGFYAHHARNTVGERFLRELAAGSGGTYQEYCPERQRIYSPEGMQARVWSGAQLGPELCWA